MSAPAANPMDLAGRTILVTGASSGIGREAAVLFSQLGARVVLVARNVERLEETRRRLAGDGHAVQPFDLCATDEIPAWMRSVAEGLAPLSGLVHCAGVHSVQPLRALTQAGLDSMMRINVGAAIALARGFRQKGVPSPDGAAMVFVSSVMGLVGQAGVAAYAATKGALNALTRSLALELARERIRVNCIAAGLVETEMTDRLRATVGADQFAAIAAMHPLGLGQPLQVAHAAAFLLADTGRWITGSTLVVDGGYTAQ